MWVWGTQTLPRAKYIKNLICKHILFRFQVFMEMFHIFKGSFNLEKMLFSYLHLEAAFVIECLHCYTTSNFLSEKKYTETVITNKKKQEQRVPHQSRRCEMTSFDKWCAKCFDIY